MTLSFKVFDIGKNEEFITQLNEVNLLTRMQ